MMIDLKGCSMTLAKLLGASALFASRVATAQAGTIVTVKVNNSTAVQADYTYEYFSGSVTPSPAAIPASLAGNFVLTSVADTVSGMRFVYASGNKKCRFAASHTVNFITKVPTWTKTGISFGITPRHL